MSRVVLAAAFAAVPWIVLLTSIARRLVVGRHLQTWQLETAIIGIAGAALTKQIDPTWSGWAAYGAALLAHGRASIGSRVGTAYGALRDYVRRHEPDVEALHAVECLGKLRWYVRGATAMALTIAVVKGAAPVAIAQWLTSEAYSRWRRWWMAYRARPGSLAWRAAVVGTVRGDVDAEQELA